MPRLFTGLELPESLAADLALMRGGLSGARWIDVENYHITLRFIGDVDEAAAREVHSALERIRRPAFEVTLNGLGAFGGDRPRAIVATAKTSPALIDLQAEQERLVRKLGLPAETRKFAPHVTLARLRQVSSVAVADYLSLRGWMASRVFEVDHFTLFSHGTRSAAALMSRKPSIRYIDRAVEGTMMRRLSLPLVLLLALHSPMVAEEDDSPAGIKTFDGWTATCNNLDACVAIATAEAEGFFYIRIARDAGAAAPPQIKLVYVTQDPLKGGTPTFTVATKQTGQTTALGSFVGKADSDDANQIAAVVPAGTPGLAFVEQIRDADAIEYALFDKKGTLDLKGLSAALRWIDARQGRAGTPTALVAKGMTPIGQVMEPRAPPIVAAAPEGSVQDLDKPILSKAVLDKAAALEDCEKETVQAHENAETWHLAADLLLVSVPCINGAYNFSAALYFTEGTGAAPRAVPLPQPPTGADGTARNVVTNMTFDPKTMLLSDFAKGRGLGDCGETRTWIWTGSGFALLEASRLDACPGALQDDWPNIYQAKRQ